jgi:REP element-mobilizing transposase RayT
MGRAPRTIRSGERYHVYSQGSNRLPIFLAEGDDVSFHLQLGRVAQKYSWRVYAYCLMPNHHHLLLRAPEGGISSGMQELNGGFSRWMSTKYSRRAHLFRNRFGATWIETEEQFVHVARYVVLNPVEAGMCKRPRHWRWSSYRATAGVELAPEWLAVNELLSHFAVFDPDNRRRGYRRFVEKPPLPCQTPSRARDAVVTNLRRG